MFIFPDAGLKDTPVFRGPNIGEPPRSEKMTRDLDGRVMIKLGDNITTDHIMPAGARLKYRSNVPTYAEFVFEKVDPSFSRRCLENKTKGFTTSSWRASPTARDPAASMPPCARCTWGSRR